MAGGKTYTEEEILLIKSIAHKFSNLPVKEVIEILKLNFPDRTSVALKFMLQKWYKRGNIKKKFTSEEDTLIYETLNKYSFNLSLGFEELAEKLKRSKQVIHQRWYYHLKKKALSDSSHPFVIAGKENHGSCKNIWRGKHEQREDFRIGINGVFYNSATSTFCNNLTF